MAEAPFVEEMEGLRGATIDGRGPVVDACCVGHVVVLAAGRQVTKQLTAGDRLALGLLAAAEVRPAEVVLAPRRGIDLHDLDAVAGGDAANGSHDERRGQHGRSAALDLTLALSLIVAVEVRHER